MHTEELPILIFPQTPKQTERGVCFIDTCTEGCAVGARAGKDVCWGAAVCAASPSSSANTRCLHAALPYLLFVPALARPGGSWERDTVVAGRNQLQKQCLYWAQLECGAGGPAVPVETVPSAWGCSSLGRR